MRIMEYMMIKSDNEKGNGEISDKNEKIVVMNEKEVEHNRDVIFWLYDFI